jgi:hypothetical protein
VARYRSSQPVELVGANDHDRITAMHRNPLRSTPLRLPNDLAQTGFGILEAPAVA